MLRRHPSTVSLVGARQSHGGPLRTRSAPRGGLRILRARLPLDRLAPLAIDETSASRPERTPMPSYLGEFVDLPADRALLSYTESGAGFLARSSCTAAAMPRSSIDCPGEWLLRRRHDRQPGGNADFTARSPAWLIAKSPTVDNGLYLSWLCGASRIRPGGDCAPGASCSAGMAMAARWR